MTTDPGGLFRRIGKLAGGLAEENTARGTQLDTRVDTTIRGQYALTQEDVLDGIRSAKLRRQQDDTWATDLKNRAQLTLLRMAQDAGWAGTSLASALEFLRVDMRGAYPKTMQTPDYRITRPVVTVASAASAANRGNGICRASLIWPIDGLALDYVFAETIDIVCQSHSYAGGQATAGREPFTATGDAAARSYLAHDWPLGSGAASSLISSYPGAAAELQSNLTDGSWEGWTVNTPNSWAVDVGAGTVTKLAGGYIGNALRITGDGATLTAVRQTLSNIQPLTAYVFNMWAQRSSNVGVLRGRLVDGANAVINDEAGNPCQFIIDLASVDVNDPNRLVNAATWYPVGGWLRTPRILPSVVKMELALTTAMTAATTLDLDAATMPSGVQAYAGGPYLSVHGGSVPFGAQDLFNVTVTNTLGASSFARTLDRYWNLRENGVRIPSMPAGDPTYPPNVLDAWIS